MKSVLMFMMPTCPYCQQAFNWMDELKKENSKFSDVEMKIIDETVHPDIADRYDYYYVPTYYVDGVKVHEGVASKEIVKNVYETALK
ncbi:thioredoxin family protein [Clostridium oryzae]|uniref:Thioredoxin-like fold domain-containing protein n=1 Tax=Clostridium oryzae TaxID=1450648 RepID=A0A1V4IHA1_9CLOT|nr:thioredoxin family protein [Clostridium oryzae]OPJ59333.1 hypothetical protein CLORY_33420 [Clostridium oryzae]